MKPKLPIWGVVKREREFVLIHYASGKELPRKFWFNPRNEADMNSQQINAGMYLSGFVDCLRGHGLEFEGFTV